MKIEELLEGKNFKDINFVKSVGDKGEREFDFNLPSDLIFFMNNDDEAYRRHLHPVISKCISKKNTSPEIFANAVKECYNMYVKEYPIRELPKCLDDKQLKETCDKLHEEVYQHIEDGKYK